MEAYPPEDANNATNASNANNVNNGNKKRKLEPESSNNNGFVVTLSREDLKRLLDPLSKEQLVSLLVDAGSQYPAVADDIRDIASKDPAHRKLFVRGLAWETTSQALREAFQLYGEIEEGAVITDKATGKSRGFGFITFKHMDSAQRALKEPSKTIDGRITVCNLASVGSSATSGSADQAQRKLYIGGLSYETSNETLLNIFSQYGEIEEGAVAYDRNTNKSRGFAFITYKTMEAAKKAIDDPNKTIEGRHVIVKLAAEGINKEKPQSGASSNQGPQVQAAGYSVVNPNLPYARPQVAGAGTPIFTQYSPGLPAAYSQPYAAAAAANAQYGAVTSAMPQYPAQYAAQYGLPPTPQPGQMPQAGAPGGGAPPPTYYASAS